MATAYRDGKHYRERAEECRVLALILETPELRDKMLKIALDYERMAAVADQSRDTTDAAPLPDKP